MSSRIVLDLHETRCSDDLIEWFACGFNAHRQIPLVESQETGENKDIIIPQRILSAHSLEMLYTGWSDTVFRKDGKVYWHGVGSHTQNDALLDLQDVYKVYGDQRGPLCVISKSSGFHWCTKQHHATSNEIKITSFDHMAVAGNGQVCIVRDQTQIISYKDVGAFAKSAPEQTWNIQTKSIVQLVSNESSFTALTIEGIVYTWGDPRYSIGREPSNDEYFQAPYIVTALEGLSLSKISSGGWISAALSSEEDLYVWGNATPGCQVIDFIPNDTGDVSLVDLGDDVSIIDVAVGSGHVCLLSRNGDVYTAGISRNGQTGIGNTGETFQKSWKKIERCWKGTAKTIHSGPFSWSTFIMVESPARK
ncbi:regulator of chromosome condensation 1/beta-lactamase-inhibitor protein II [Geopyxis carbonaria]|nr:regulator of chromosome condensation 1/beta-lactamase-inhibitor protein II [Geopyxis carbonaria]